jgi:DNA polymerase-3 subunit delta'
MKKENAQINWGFCGQKPLVDFLQSALAKGKPSQAYLLVGQGNIGKSTLAMKFASALLCTNKTDLTACGECFHCRQISNGCHPDMTVIDRLSDDKTDKMKREISVEQIRDLCNKLQQTSFLDSYKIAVIPEAQYLNQNSANALLKIMEEPYGKSIMILVADDLSRLPKTIASRCQVLRFLPVPEPEISKYLTGLGADPENAGKLAKLAFGRPGLAVDYFRDQELFKERHAEAENLLSVISLNLAERFLLVDSIIDWQEDETINIKKLGSLFASWQSLLRDFLLLKNDNSALVSNLALLPKLEKMAGEMDFVRIKRCLAEVEKAKEYIHKNIASKFILENLIINL